MSRTYPGGILTANPPATAGPSGEFNEGGSASGVWTMADASRLQGSSLWPVKIKSKYLWGWGYGAQGNIGEGLVISRSSPVQVGAAIDWSSQLKSGQANIALKTTGALFTWGFADKGSLGINESGNKSAPTQVGALTSWSKVFAGRLQNGAIKNDGTLWIWGTSAYGRLGNNVAGFSDANSRSSPIQIGADTNWSTLALSTQHNIAIRTTGTIWGWGVNSAGKIGLNRGSSLDYVSSPTQIGTETNWSKVVCGAQHTLAIKSDNTLWAWGSNGFGELGDNTAMYTPRLNKSSPVQVGGAEWQDVFLSTGAYHSVGIKTNGTLWAWGKNTDGRLGNNTTIDRSSPTQIGSLTTWSKATTGQGTIAALKTDGTMWIWGQAFFSHGVFGDNVGHASAVNRSSPAQIGSDTDWRVISMGDWSAALAVKAI